MNILFKNRITVWTACIGVTLITWTCLQLWNNYCKDNFVKTYLAQQEEIKAKIEELEKYQPLDGKPHRKLVDSTELSSEGVRTLANMSKGNYFFGFTCSFDKSEDMQTLCTNKAFHCLTQQVSGLWYFALLSFIFGGSVIGLNAAYDRFNS